MAALRSKVQATLVYFGLAQEPGEEGRPKRVGKDVFVVGCGAAVFAGGVWTDRGPAVGAIAYALFVPMVVLGLVGRIRRLTDPTLVDLEDTLAIPPVFFGGLLLLVPNHVGLWPPIAGACVLSALFCGAGVRRLLRRRRDPSPAHLERSAP